MKSNLLWILLISFLTLSCASTSEPTPAEKRGSAQAHPAAFSQDHFTFNKPQKKREDNDFDFYYKHCSVDDRHPFPVGAIWQCTEP